MWMATTGKDASRIGAKSRWREGIFLGLFGAGRGANDFSIGAPDGVEARAMELEPEKCLGRGALLERERTAMGPQAR